MKSMNNQALPINQVILGDCIDALNALPDNAVDLIFADPPYNLQLQQDLWRPNMTKVDPVDEPWDRFESFRDYDAFTRSWLTACQRVLKETGAIWVIGTYHNIFRVGAIMQDLGYWLLNDVVWVKTNPMPNFRGVRFTNAHETLLWAQKKRSARYTFNYRNMKAFNGELQMRSDWYLPLCTGKERIKVNGEKAHPTQKPEALLYRIILASSNPGDIVLDPFFGSGTTGVVAQKLHRRWIGIERDKGYVEIARRRISEVAESEYVVEVYDFERSHRQPRLPFGALLELGLLVPGQKLFFGSKGGRSAIIQANGHLHCEGLTGSIHQVGKALLNAPCNGWEHWFYQDERTGELLVIDHLRQVAREMVGHIHGKL